METAVDQNEVITSDVSDVKESPKEELKETYEIDGEEKYKTRDIENDFLKAQVEIRQLQDRHNQLMELVKKTQTDFPKHIEEMAKKRNISLDDYVFNSVELKFVRKPKDNK